MGNLRRRLRPPRLLPLLLADRLLAAPCIVFTVIGLAGRRRRSRYRPLVRDAGFALQGLATLALDRADPGCVLGQLGDQRLGHARIAGRLALDRQIAAQRARGRRAELAVGRCGQASEPDQFVLGGANQLARIGLARRTLGGLGIKPVKRRDDHGPEPVAGHAPRKLRTPPSITRSAIAYQSRFRKLSPGGCATW